MEDEFLYRYDDPGLLYCVRFRVVKHTPCGVWIQTGPSTRKFVLLNTHKSFACATKEEAWKSFIARRKRQIEIVASQLERAQAALTLDPSEAKDYSIEFT